MLGVAVVVLLVIAVGFVVVIVNRIVGGSRSPGAAAQAPAASGRATPSTRPEQVPVGFSGCSEVPDGFCPATQQCWGGLVILAGTQATARPKPCDEPHYWETYAGGWLPATAVSLPLDVMSKRSEIARVCTKSTMEAAARSKKDVRGWELELLPVQLSGSGTWVFHCVAAPAGGGEVTGSAFRR